MKYAHIIFLMLCLAVITSMLFVGARFFAG